MIRRPPRSTLSSSSAASDVYKRQVSTQSTGLPRSEMAEPGSAVLRASAEEERIDLPEVLSRFGVFEMPTDASGGTILKADSLDDIHAYSVVPHEEFKLRGANYLADGVKVRASEPMMHLCKVDMYRSEKKVYSVVRDDPRILQELKQQATPETEFMVVNFLCPIHPFVNVVLYFKTDPDRIQANGSKAFKEMLDCFLNSPPTSRNDQWRLRTLKLLAQCKKLSLIHISEPTRLLSISYAVFCLKKKKKII
eukprot:TRINITY_DN12604_c0_g1_i2.p1 TRINITY_DN12604_c0_g1~~TRINITY_DN12604_c0_g1_i2.p1  ORF type:complete len:251 (+),score=76.17 TRINITY_DN12604_c0_g1_i2:136-888(+)